MKLKIAIAIITIMMLLMTACAPITGEVTAAKSIKIGYSGPLTGDLASLGEANLQGIELAVEEINAQGGIAGRPVQLIVQDDMFEGAMTLDAYQKFTDIDDVDVMLTATFGGMLTVAERADAEEVVVVETVDTAEELAGCGEFSFAVGIYDEGIGYALADFAGEKFAGKKVGVIYLDSDPFVMLVKDSFIQKFQGTPVIVEGYSGEESDFRTHLIKAKEKGAELLVVLGFEEAGLVLKQARELGIEAEFAGIDIFGTDALFDHSQGAAKGAYFTSWEAGDAEKYEKFATKYKEKYGHEPEQAMFTVLGHDAVKVVAKAMEDAAAKGEQPRGKALKESLEQIKGFEGLAGDITMGEDGIVRSIKEEMFQIADKGQFKKI
jgi:branched-chain amino acid transport system substrate-binding protein